MNIYVGNLPFSIKDSELNEMFSQFGGVKSVKIVTDNQTGRSRGFAFVEMDSRENGESAVDSLNGKDFGGRKLVVNEARPKTDRPSGGRGGDRGFRGDR